ncbi:MAG: hypothetical protein BroJett011_03760 [Chloroflexota bacterium]|nr:MAG: hypothetical protein BroJett011_03760 [Chloroflexota bacterium]
MTLLAVVLIVLIGAVIYGYRQAMEQTSHLPAARPRFHEEADPLRVRLARAEWRREGWKWTSEK